MHRRKIPKSCLLLLLIYCFMYLSLFVGVLCWPLFWFALLNVLSNYAIILTRKRELDASLLLSFGCLVTVNVLWLFLKVPWVGLQFLIVVIPDHTHFLCSGRYVVVFVAYFLIFLYFSHLQISLTGLFYGCPLQV